MPAFNILAREKLHNRAKLLSCSSLHTLLSCGSPGSELSSISIASAHKPAFPLHCFSFISNSSKAVSQSCLLERFKFSSKVPIVVLLLILLWYEISLDGLNYFSHKCVIFNVCFYRRQTFCSEHTYCAPASTILQSAQEGSLGPMFEKIHLWPSSGWDVHMARDVSTWILGALSLGILST